MKPNALLARFASVPNAIAGTVLVSSKLPQALARDTAARRGERSMTTIRARVGPPQGNNAASAEIGARTATAHHRSVVTSDGVSLSVCDYGSPTAEYTVLLLHGFCLNKEAWNIQARQLIHKWGNRIRVITYDHRGHGNSTEAPMHTYTIERLAADLAELITALEVTGQLILVGHSMGGMTALAYLARAADKRPIEPQGLVLAATAAGRLAERGLGRLLATPAAEILYELVQHAPRTATNEVMRVLARPICGMLTRYGGYGTHRREALAAVSAGAINDTPLRTKAGFLRTLRHFDQYPTLASITATTAVIGGGDDRFTPPVHAHELAANIAGATLLRLPKAGHMVLHEAPRLVTQTINDVIARSAPPANRTLPRRLKNSRNPAAARNAC